VSVALITGAGSGIGFEVARQLARTGMQVVLTARTEEKATTAAKALADEGLPVTPMMLDVVSESSVATLAARIGDEPGRLDVLVNNAAGPVDRRETASTADLRISLGLVYTNLFGTWRVTQALLPLLRRSPHPRIVNVSSGAGSHGDESFGLTANGGTTASHGISKAAINALTATLAAELADTPVIVNAVCPGLTATAPGMEAMGARPVADGAASVVWAALLADDGPRGGFFRDGTPLPW
jgi:NAD(P)-dependent dehydrogenase (short-subunit alcohol dehydrogenase family)